MTPVQMLNAIVEIKQPKWRSADDPQKIRKSIKSQMKAYMKRGIVVRVGNAGHSKNADGIWALPEFANVPWEAGEVMFAS